MSQYPVASTTLLKANQQLRVSGRVLLRYRKTRFGLRLWVDAVADPRSCSASIEIARWIWVPLERVRGVCAQGEKGVGAIVMQNVWSS